MSLEDCFFMSLIFLEEFIKRTLIGVYYIWQKFDYWSHNRRVAADAKAAEENPTVLPDITNDNT